MDYAEVIKNLLFVVVGGFAIYFQYNKKLQEKIADITAQAIILIKEAEVAYKDTTKAGGLKFEFVVQQLYKLVPKMLQPILTKQAIADIVQRTFEQIEAYAKQKLDSVSDKITNED